MRAAPASAAALCAALFTGACTPEPTPISSLNFLGEGYRFKGDACRQLGESPLTAEYLDHTADLVACPEDLENLGVFAIDHSATEVARLQGFVLFSVPLS
ncbi:MAG: hypothetical protein ACSHWZ_02855 [Sulfitobacter sp.]